MRSLLDVNILIALLDQAHTHHAVATNWFFDNQDGWASCPITQMGVIRILSQPNYTNSQPMSQVRAALSLTAEHTNHAFWPDDLSLLKDGSIDWGHLVGHRQITDAYLLALAVTNGGRVATFDAHFPIKAVPNAQPDSVAVVRV